MIKGTKMKKNTSIEALTGRVKIMNEDGKVIARLDAGQLPGTSSLADLVTKIAQAYECRVSVVGA